MNKEENIIEMPITDKSEQVTFLERLISKRSITPKDEGVIDLLVQELSNIGFICHKLQFFGDGQETTMNLYATYGTGDKNLCFSGHVDVVHPGAESSWNTPPFSATIIENKIYGRGIVDMKGAVSAFVIAVKKYVSGHTSNSNYKVSILLSGNEEEDPTNGMVKSLRWIKEHNHKIDACIVGEPTSVSKLGDTIKNGRRGSMSFELTITGKQGHVAYPENAENPITIMSKILYELSSIKLDDGSEYFDPSNLEITSINSDNLGSNVIPGTAFAAFNIRYNTEHNFNSLRKTVNSIIQKHTKKYSLKEIENSVPFINSPTNLINIVKSAIKDILQIDASLSTSGGTSDARFIKDICPVIELGLINKTAHQANEYSSIEDLHKLADVYYKIIEYYFKE